MSDRLLDLIDAAIAERLSGVEGLQRLSDSELITQLANQAKELGIEIDLSCRLGDSPEPGRDRARGLYSEDHPAADARAGAVAGAVKGNGK
jgi:hypothetical protein